MSVTDGPACPEPAMEGNTMDGMAPAPAHAKPVARHDHLWVLGVIAAVVLAEVWASWVGIGALSGFPRLGRIPTDWVLAVAMEAYWAYALYAWLAAAPGPRSRAFAMWSCAFVFVLSLVGQVTYHELTAPPGTTPGRRVVIGFVTVLPVIILALIAVLIHLRHLDRAEAAEADERSTVQAEMGALRAESEAQTEALAAAHADRDAAQREAAEATAKADAAARKLAAAAGRKNPRKAPPQKTIAAPRSKGDPAPATEVPNDVDAQAEALSILAAEPDISGAKLGERLGMSERWGQTFKKNLAAAAAPKGQDPQE